MQKILIIAPSWIGDMVMAEPLLKILQQRHSRDSHSYSHAYTPPVRDHNQTATIIDVVVPAYLAPLLARMPHINHVWTTSFTHGNADLKARWLLARRLREQHYAQVIVLPNSFKSALLPFWARIPRRTGWRGEMRYALLNDMRILDAKRFPFMVQRLAALGFNSDDAWLTEIAKFDLSRLLLTSQQAQISPQTPAPQQAIVTAAAISLVPRLTTNAACIAQTLAELRPILPELPELPELPALSASQELPELPAARSKPTLALCMGAEYGEAKRWPATYFAEVAKHKFKEGWNIWLFGGASDVALAGEVQFASGNICLDLTGKTTLAQAVDLLSLTQAVVTNDTGLMHIAAALDLPVVAIYGSSSPQFTPPLTSKVRILSLNLPCSPCFQRRCLLGHFRCMLELHPVLVLQALQELRICL